MWFGVRENDMMLLILKEVVASKSRVFEFLARETRGESSTERRAEKIYVVVFVGVDVVNLLGGQCGIKYCYKVLKMLHIKKLYRDGGKYCDLMESILPTIDVPLAKKPSMGTAQQRFFST